MPDLNALEQLATKTVTAGAAAVTYTYQSSRARYVEVYNRTAGITCYVSLGGTAVGNGVDCQEVAGLQVLPLPLLSVNQAFSYIRATGSATDATLEITEYGN